MPRRKREEIDDNGSHFASCVLERMAKLGLTVRDVSDETNTTYEYTRRCVRGITVPSAAMVGKLAKLLKMDESELQTLAMKDKVSRRYGELSSALTGRDVDLEPVAAAWRSLTEQQKHDLKTMIQALARSNRHGG